MTAIERLPEIVYHLSQVNKVNEIVDVINDNYNMYYTGTNPALTPVNGVATWTVTHNLGTEAVTCSVYQNDSLVIAKIDVTSENVVTVQFNASATVAANTYSIMITAGGASGSGGGTPVEIPTKLSEFEDDLGSNPTHTHSNKEDKEKAMPTLGTTGTIALADNSAYQITPTGTVTFSLPSVTDKTKLHQILVQLKLTSVYTINLGTTYFFNKTKPDLSTTGTYTLVYEYDNLGNYWVCGGASKGTQS